MIDFWATWCGPCLQEMPNVLANYERYHKRGFDVLAVSLDGDTPGDQEKVSRFMEERKIKSDSTPWSWENQGKLTPYRFGKSIYYRRVEVDNLMQKAR